MKMGNNVVIELTNRCNLRCLHCLDARHSADGEQQMETLEKVLREARALGFHHLSFTGGEPTLHRRFAEVLKKTCEAGYQFGFVTNGWNFVGVFDSVLQCREGLTGITFSLDGAREETHDKLRGKGSFRQVMRAVSVCVVRDIHFTFNSVLTSFNQGELKETVQLAKQLGSRGVRLGHLLPTQRTMEMGMDLSLEERREVEDTIRELQRTCDFPVVMAPGYHTHKLFPCASLQLEEFNIDWQGNVSLCSHLSGYGDKSTGKDTVGNLSAIGLPEAMDRLTALVGAFRKDKRQRHSSRGFEDFDYLPCWYCLNHFGKIDWLKTVP
jgi:MoaA/NifB/PqqE/SkfB family radical SAM enzyme